MAENAGRQPLRCEELIRRRALTGIHSPFVWHAPVCEDKQRHVKHRDMSFGSEWLATLADCVSRWPRLETNAETSEVYRSIWPALSPERRAEWLLARLALAGNASAQQVIDAWVVRLLEAWFRRQRFPQELRDDALQEVRGALFGLGAKAELAQFEGLGPLDRWLQVVSVRRALNVLRSSAHSRDVALDDVEEERLGLTLGADLRLLKKDQQQAFKQAFEAALQTLDDRGRLLLSMRYLQGASVEHLATLLGAHRVSVSKWLAEARHAVQREVLVRLEGNARSRPLAEWASSQPNLSISRLFRLPA